MYILGIDCGGSSTEALLTTQEGRVLGYGQGGPANYTVNGTSGVVQSVLTAVRGSLEQSGLQLENLHQRGVVLALGVSGAGRSAEQVQIRRALESEGFAQVVVAHDAVIALLGALSGADGVVVIAGTGSVAYGVNGERSHRVGGWGYLLGDEGGAVWIALKALQQVMWGYDGRLTEDETLLQAAKVYFGIGEPMELIPLIYKTPLDRGLIAGFSTVIGKLAQEGHAAAQEILVDAGRQLGRLAVAALQELGLAEAKGRVGACGGVFSAGQWVLEPMAEEIRRAAPEQTLTLADFKPAAGAVFLAARHLGLDLPSVAAGLEESLY